MFASSPGMSVRCLLGQEAQAHLQALRRHLFAHECSPRMLVCCLLGQQAQARLQALRRHLFAHECSPRMFVCCLSGLEAQARLQALRRHLFAHECSPRMFVCCLSGQQAQARLQALRRHLFHFPSRPLAAVAGFTRFGEPPVGSPVCVGAACPHSRRASAQPPWIANRSQRAPPPLFRCHPLLFVTARVPVHHLLGVMGTPLAWERAERTCPRACTP